MALRAEFDGVIVQADSPAELASLIRELRQGANVTANSSPVPAVLAVPQSPPSSSPAPVEPNKSKQMRRLFRSVENAEYKAMLRFLANRPDGATDAELREHSGFEGKLAGFTATVHRRAPGAGLAPDEVMVSIHEGVQLGKRVFRYRVTPGMAEAIRKADEMDAGQVVGGAA